MEFIKFVKTLLPQFGKDRLVEDARICRTELETVTLVAYKDAVKALGTGTLKSKANEDFNRRFQNVVRQGVRGNVVARIDDYLERALKTIEVVEKAVNEEFEIEVVVAGITLYKASLIRMLELGSFISTFSLRFLNLIYINESAAVGAGDAYILQELSKGEIDFIDKHFEDFCVALSVIGQPDKTIVKTLETLPQILVNEKSEATMATVGAAKIDPLGLFRVRGFTYNPIYHIGLMVAEIQTERYKRAKDLKAVLELRLLHLERQRDGSNDAALDKEIHVIQSRVDGLSEKIRNFEESLK